MDATRLQSPCFHRLRAVFTVGCMGLCLLLGSCNRHTPAPGQSSAVAWSGSAAKAIAAHEPEQKLAWSTWKFTPFDVRVRLSPAAATAMKQRHETLIVSATYFGWPASGYKLPVDDVGQVPLGNAQHELSRPGTTHFDGRAFALDKTAGLNGEPQVNINVYSGRHSSPDNLLDCGVFDGTVVLASHSIIVLDCTLLPTS